MMTLLRECSNFMFIKSASNVKSLLHEHSGVNSLFCIWSHVKSLLHERSNVNSVLRECSYVRVYYMSVLM